jgi:hypothetical protein
MQRVAPGEARDVDDLFAMKGGLRNLDGDARDLLDIIGVPRVLEEPPQSLSHVLIRNIPSGVIVILDLRFDRQDGMVLMIPDGGRQARAEDDGGLGEEWLAHEGISQGGLAAAPTAQDADADCFRIRASPHVRDVFLDLPEELGYLAVPDPIGLDPAE